MFIASAVGGVGAAILGSSIVGGVSSVMGANAQKDAAGQAADAQSYATDRQIQYLEDARDEAVNAAKVYGQKAFIAQRQGAQNVLAAAVGKPIIEGARRQGVTRYATPPKDKQQQPKDKTEAEKQADYVAREAQRKLQTHYPRGTGNLLGWV